MHLPGTRTLILVAADVQCKTAKVESNLKAMQNLLPETMDTTAVAQYMPSLLLTDLKKVLHSNFLKHSSASPVPDTPYVICQTLNSAEIDHKFARCGHGCNVADRMLVHAG